MTLHPGGDARRHCVLVVERDETVLTSLCRLLAFAGYDSTVARNDLEALSALWHVAADAALIDLRLLGLGGSDLVSTLRRYWPELPIIVAVASSGRANIPPLHAVVQLRKPFDQDAFHHALKLALPDSSQIGMFQNRDRVPYYQTDKNPSAVTVSLVATRPPPYRFGPFRIALRDSGLQHGAQVYRDVAWQPVAKAFRA